MKIIQVLPSFSYGDAIGNDTLALKDAIQDLGYETGIYALMIDERVAEKAKPVNDIPEMTKEDIMIFHLAIGSEFSNEIEKYNCKKIAVYHNITPGEFFEIYNKAAYSNCITGLEQARYLNDKFDYCLADSEFNKQDLIKMGYKCPIDVLPILIAFDDYKKEPSKKIIDRYKDGKTNIIFVGRVAPNKKHEDIIKAFYYYKKYLNKDARLFLVGSYDGSDPYYVRLKEYVLKLGLQDVYFTGHIKFDEILGYYKVADVFLSMSEHEGFCVPLVESMFFKVPILAYNSTAIGWTLGGSGIMFDEKNYMEVAELINKIAVNNELRDMIISRQNRRLEDFSNERVKKIFTAYINKFIKNSIK